MDTENDKSVSKKFIIILCAVCAAVVLVSPIIGFCVPKGDTAVLKGLNTLHKNDKTYLAAKADSDSAATENSTLTESLSEKQNELDKFHTSQDNLGKITELNADLENEKSRLEDEIKQKQKTLSSLEASASSYANKITTLTSGDYTVGKDIAAGNYMITGSGSIAVARNGKSIANKLLKAEGERFTLNRDDRIHIDGSAKIIPQ